MTEKIMELIMEISRQMIESGAEIGRVEESITRMCQAYGCVPQAYATSSNVILSVNGEDGFHYTCSRRVKKASFDMERLHLLNDLVRRITATAPDEDFIRLELRKISDTPRYANWLQILCYALIAVAFCVFFGGRDFVEILSSFLIGGAVGLAGVGLNKLRCNKILNSFMCSFLSAATALFLFRFHAVPTPDNIIIGNIMSLIPGIGVTNSLRDLFTGDTITGLMRFMESILLALAIALGYWVAVFVLGGAA